MNVSARQLAPLLIVAFIVGGLFRLYNISGTGLYRMFGTMGIVVMGFLGTRIVQSWQLHDASAGMRDVIDNLPAGWQALERGAPIGVIGWQGYLVGADRTLAVTTLTVANYVKGRRLRQTLRRGVVRAEALAEAAPARHIVFPIVPCVVLLRRRADEETQLGVEDDMLVVDVDGLSLYLAERTSSDGTVSADVTDSADSDCATIRSNNPPMA